MKSIYSLDKNWSFKIDNLENDTVVNLPHTWNVNGNVERLKCLYSKTINIDINHRKDHIYLEFLGSNSVTQVYINEHFVGEHRGGYSTFRFEITEYYNWNDENILKVYVDNSQTEDVSPLLGDFTVYGGIYRSVNLICQSDDPHFDLMFYGSSGVIVKSEVDSKGNGILEIENHILTNQDLKIRFTLKDENGSVVAYENIDLDVSMNNHSLWNKKNIILKNYTLSVENCHLWNGRNNPYLYELEVELTNENSIFDSIKIKTGFRNCHLDSNKGFYLNGERVKINGVSKHQDFENVGNAITCELLQKDFDLIDEIGANSIRLSHYQHSQETYNLCDIHGYIIWAEIPMMLMPNKPEVLVNAKNQLYELIYQNAHHPSICFWGIQNEIAMNGESLAMYKGVNELNDIVHSILPKGISASANMNFVKNDSTLNFITDLLGYNHYFGWYYGKEEDLDEWIDKFHIENPNVALGISEYGADCNLKYHSDNPKVKDYSEEFQALYHEKTYKIIESKDYLWGSYVWNMFDFGSFVRDEGGTKGKNTKGLVTFDRETRKDAFYFYKAKWSKNPFVHICEKRFVNRSNNTMTVKVYSNLESLDISVNNEMIESLSSHSVFTFSNIKLDKKENVVHVKGIYQGNVFEDKCIFNKVENKDQNYIFVDPNPGLNVENWFTQEKGELDFFPNGVYSIKDKICDLMLSKEAWNIVVDKAPKVAERATPESTVTLLWVFNKMRAIFTEEVIMDINNALIKIKK